MKKSLLWFFVVIVYIVASSPVTEDYADKPQNSRYIVFPDGEGYMHLVDLEATPDIILLRHIESHPTHHYYLFTRRNPRQSQTLAINKTNTITNSNFNASVPTVVIAHGWFSDHNDDINPTLREAFLDTHDVNVIIMDWSRVAMSDYATASVAVPEVGRDLGQFLTFLKKITGQGFDQMHLVGFSLGAHLVGNAGRELRGKIARITALDPAGPLWKYNTLRIRPNNAVYVEAIHTDSGHTFGSLGIRLNVGDADFYPNGGITQPGCVTNVCNHNRAWQLFAATVKYNHLNGRMCAKNLKQLTRDNCRGPHLRMGNGDLKKMGYGMYYVDTYRWYPY